MIKMKITEQEAQSILSQIKHKTFRKGFRKHWQNGRGPAQKICWLYCWGNKELQWPRTSQQARDAFEAIYNKPYDWLEKRISIEQAYIFRHIY